MERRIDEYSLICWIGHKECDDQKVQKLSQRRLTADSLPHGTVTVHGCTVKSPISRTRKQFSRCSKWLDTFRKAVVCITDIRSESIEHIIGKASALCLKHT